MRKRMLIVAAGALLGAGGLAIAQNVPVTASANTVTKDGSRTTLSGNAVFVVNGVTVRADRIVIDGRDVSLEGNVRMTLPPGSAPIYTAAAMRGRITPPAPTIVPLPYRRETPIIDTPIPPPWEPPAKK